ncbi:MAG: tyrosine-type recombinase/integrase [Candidatus Sulfotelmatobacter sp.]
MRAKRDYAMLAMLFGCGFRGTELVGLDLDDLQMRQGHWAVVDLIGKGGHIRTVPHSELGESHSGSMDARSRGW